MLVRLHEQDALLKAEEPGLRAAHPWGVLMLQVVTWGREVLEWQLGDTPCVRACAILAIRGHLLTLLGSTPVTQGVFTERHCP